MKASLAIGPVGASRGSTILEVLVALLVIAVGLLGIAGLQSRLVVSEVEAYQRTQALILLNDMADRMQSNRGQASDYLTGSAPLGTGIASCAALASASAPSAAERDRRDWCNALQGASEVINNNKRGAMIGARGCIEATTANPPIYNVSIAWQGLTPFASPSNTCGKLSGGSSGSNNYDTAGTPCVDDRCRRVVTIQVPIGDLAP